MIPPQYFLGSLYYVFSVSTIDPLSEHCLLTPSMGSLLAHHYLLVTISVNMAGITNLGVGIAPSITSSYAGLEWPPKILEIILRCRSLPTDNRFFSFFFKTSLHSDIRKVRVLTPSSSVHIDDTGSPNAHMLTEVTWPQQALWWTWSIFWVAIFTW